MIDQEVHGPNPCVNTKNPKPAPPGPHPNLSNGTYVRLGVIDATRQHGIRVIFWREQDVLNCCCVAHGCSHKSQEANYQELPNFCDLTRILSMISQPMMTLTNDLVSLWSLYNPFCSFVEQCSFTALRLSVLTAALQAGALEHSTSNEIEI